ncbi:TetR/AcrR family transcriptional regulator [Natranaerofaba carboxydovora]|uniref:TetR/AcrR family transcriptional regulator n=1 Tax=Natranaerofaba carboxydovora TaxID=2742683 RepID=UPI001F144F82|nr:TetR/AcrR family transcriptional regulator [Natranaerofaba carboxydovora]UMZ74263.1 HTH-type transcriptional regulator MtrR [Natranaerofaba carboxydovora]
METKEKIFKAATDTISEKGVNNLTLNEVCKRAKISKGGLLYHFPSKDELIKALVEYNEITFENQMKSSKNLNSEKAKSNKVNSEKNILESYVDVTFDSENLFNETSKGLLAAVLLNPDLLEPIKDRSKRLVKQMKDMINDNTDEKQNDDEYDNNDGFNNNDEKNSTDYIEAEIIRLAVDGFWLSELLGINYMKEEEKEKVKSVLKAKAQELEKEDKRKC